MKNLVITFGDVETGWEHLELEGQDAILVWSIAQRLIAEDEDSESASEPVTV